MKTKFETISPIFGAEQHLDADLNPIPSFYFYAGHNPNPDPDSSLKLANNWLILSVHFRTAVRFLAELWIRIRMLLGFPDPSLYCTDPDLDQDPVLTSTNKKSKKSLDFYYFGTSFDFLSVKTDVNVPSKMNKQKT